jgi:hypothetical protein
MQVILKLDLISNKFVFMYSRMSFGEKSEKKIQERQAATSF